MAAMNAEIVLGSLKIEYAKVPVWHFQQHNYNREKIIC
jgi:hypothetical protein